MLSFFYAKRRLNRRLLLDTTTLIFNVGTWKKKQFFTVYVDRSISKVNSREMAPQ